MGHSDQGSESRLACTRDGEPADRASTTMARDYRDVLDSKAVFSDRYRLRKRGGGHDECTRQQRAAFIRKARWFHMLARIIAAKEAAVVLNEPRATDN